MDKLEEGVPASNYTCPHCHHKEIVPYTRSNEFGEIICSKCGKLGWSAEALRVNRIVSKTPNTDFNLTASPQVKS